MFQDLQDVIDYQEDYEEHQRIMQELTAIKVIGEELAEEKAKPQPKFAPLARKNLATLREIFKNGDLKDDAQWLIEELTLLQTMPLAELDLPWNADSYTGEPLDPQLNASGRAWIEATAAEEQWYKDFDEVQEQIKLVGDPNDETDILLYSLLNVQPSKAEKHEPSYAKVVVRMDESELTRMVQELRDLGYGEHDIELAMNASRFSFEDEEEVQYEEGEIPSVPLQQEEEMELKMNVKELQDIRRDAKQIIDRFQTMRSKAFAWLSTTGQDKAFSKVSSNLRKDHRHVSKEIYKSMGQYQKEQIFRKIVDVCLWRKQFIRLLQTRANLGYTKQAIAMVFLSLQDDKWGIHMEDAKQIVFFRDDEIMPGSEAWLEETTVEADKSTLFDFIEMYGDVILDEALDPVTSGNPTSDYQIAMAADAIEEELIATFADDDLPLKVAGSKLYETIPLTKSYARGVFSATGSDLHEAGMSAWRWEKSHVGELAFQKAIKAGKTLKQAWSAFWNAGTITAVNSNGVKVLSHANGKVQLCDWGLAKWKLTSGELFISKDDRLRLKSILLNNGWGRNLTSIL